MFWIDSLKRLKNFVYSSYVFIFSRLSYNSFNFSSIQMSKFSKSFGWLFKHFCMSFGRKSFCIHNLTAFHICFKNILFNKISFWSNVWLINRFNLTGFSQYSEKIFRCTCSSCNFVSWLFHKNSFFSLYEYSWMAFVMVSQSNNYFINNHLNNLYFSFLSKIVRGFMFIHLFFR